MFEEETIGNWVGGCLLQAVAIVLLYIFFPDKDVVVTAVALAIVLSPLALLARWLMHVIGLEGRPWDALLGPVCLALCLVIGYIHPIRGDKSPDAPDKSATASPSSPNAPGNGTVPWHALHAARGERRLAGGGARRA